MLYITAGRLEMLPPASSALLLCSMYASLPASVSVKSLTMPVPKFCIMSGSSSMELTMIMPAVRGSTLVEGSSILSAGCRWWLIRGISAIIIIR